MLLGMLLIANAAFAQNDFQLPRECSERNNVNPEKCVIQDGPPRVPVVRRVPAVVSAQITSVPAVAPTASVRNSSQIVRQR